MWSVSLTRDEPLRQTFPVSLLLGRPDELIVTLKLAAIVLPQITYELEILKMVLSAHGRL